MRACSRKLSKLSKLKNEKFEITEKEIKNGTISDFIELFSDIIGDEDKEERTEQSDQLLGPLRHVFHLSPLIKPVLRTSYSCSRVILSSSCCTRLDFFSRPGQVIKGNRDSLNFSGARVSADLALTSEIRYSTSGTLEVETEAAPLTGSCPFIMEPLIPLAPCGTRRTPPTPPSPGPSPRPSSSEPGGLRSPGPSSPRPPSPPPPRCGSNWSKSSHISINFNFTTENTIWAKGAPSSARAINGVMTSINFDTTPFTKFSKDLEFSSKAAMLASTDPKTLTCPLNIHKHDPPMYLPMCSVCTGTTDDCHRLSLVCDQDHDHDQDQNKFTHLLPELPTPPQLVTPDQTDQLETQETPPRSSTSSHIPPHPATPSPPTPCPSESSRTSTSSLPSKEKNDNSIYLFFLP